MKTCPIKRKNNLFHKYLIIVELNKIQCISVQLRRNLTKVMRTGNVCGKFIISVAAIRVIRMGKGAVLLLVVA